MFDAWNKKSKSDKTRVNGFERNHVSKSSQFKKQQRKRRQQHQQQQRRQQKVQPVTAVNKR